MPAHRTRVPYYGLVDWTRQIVDRHTAAEREQRDARQRWGSFEHRWCAACARLTQHIVTDYVGPDGSWASRIVRCWRCPVEE